MPDLMYSFNIEISGMRLTLYAVERSGLLLELTAVPPASVCAAETPLLRETEQQLKEYAAGERRSFRLPLCPAATAFAAAVREAMLSIPYGEMCSYGELARNIGRPGAARAVGGACHRNPLLLIVPCHRVAAASGIGGFALGTELKQQLLRHEKEHISTR